MKKNLFIPCLTLLIVFLLNSCELLDDANPANDDVIEKIEGQWKCTENSQYFKNTAQRIYYPYISRHPDDSTKVIIGDFYEVGDAVAKLNGRALTLSRQNLPGDFILLSGNGTISSNYKEITWSYSIDDGSGEADNATAVYSKSY